MSTSSFPEEMEKYWEDYKSGLIPKPDPYLLDYAASLQPDYEYLSAESIKKWLLNKAHDSGIQTMVKNGVVATAVDLALNSATGGVTSIINNVLDKLPSIFPSCPGDKKLGDCAASSAAQLLYWTRDELKMFQEYDVPPIAWNDYKSYNFKYLYPKYVEFREKNYREASESQRLSDLPIYMRESGKSIYHWDYETNRFIKVQ